VRAEASPPTEGSNACPLCGATTTDRPILSSPDRLYETPGTFCVLVCQSCSVGWTLPRASTQELGAFYPETYMAYVPPERGLLRVVQRLGQRTSIRRQFARRPLSQLGFVSQGDVLDVGCGSGEQGAELVRRGWRVAGIDPSEQACAAASSRGVQAVVATLESAPFAPESFDAVVMNHSLEHVADPRDDLGRVFRLLRPGGLLLITVPNFASWQRVRFGTNWLALELPRHRTHFTPRSLGRALAAEGFEVASIQTAGDAWVLICSIQYAALGRLVLIRPPLSWIGHGLSIVLAPLNWILDRLLGEGGLIAVVARRPENELRA